MSTYDIDTEENTMAGTHRRLTGPLNERHYDILDLLAQGMRQTEVSEMLTISPSYVSAELNVIVARMAAKSSMEAIALYSRQKTYREVAERVRGAKVWSPANPGEEHVNHVLDGIAAEYELAALRILPRPAERP